MRSEACSSSIVLIRRVRQSNLALQILKIKIRSYIGLLLATMVNKCVIVGCDCNYEENIAVGNLLPTVFVYLATYFSHRLRV
jgi:hypothetical protein